MRKVFLAGLLILLSFDGFAQYRLDKLYQDAWTELYKNNYPLAIAKFDILISHQPSQFEFYFLRGKCKYFLDDFYGAERDFSEAIHLNAYYTEAFHYRALIRDNLGKYQDALSDHNRAIELKVDNAELYADRALNKIYSEDFKGAIEDCEKAIEFKLTNATIYLCRGAAWHGLKNFEKALIDYNKAISLNPFNGNSFVRRAMLRRDMKQHEQALNDLNTALKIDSLNTYAYFQRGATKFDSDDLKGALEDYNKVLSIDPLNSLILYNRAILWIKKGDKKAAIEDMSKVIKINPENILAIYDRGKLRHEMGDHKKAMQDYDKTIALFPYLPEAYYNRSVLKQTMNNPSGARADYATGKSVSEMNRLKSREQAKRDSAKFVELSRFKTSFDSKETSFGRIQNENISIQLESFFFLSQADSATRKSYYCKVLNDFNVKAKGRFVFTNASKEKQDLKIPLDTSSSVALIKRGIVYYHSYFFNDAEKDFSSAIIKDSSQALAYFSRGTSHCKEAEFLKNFNTSKNGETAIYEKAIKDFDKSISLSPDFSFAYYNRAFAKSKLNDINGAVKDLEGAIKSTPDFAEAHFNKGLLLIYLKNTAEGCQSLSRAGEQGMKEAYSTIKKLCN